VPSLDLINGLVAGLGMLLSLFAAWILHRRVRMRSSAVFAWLTTVMCVWPFVSYPAFATVIYYSGNPLPESWANALILVIDQIIPALLSLAAAVFFLLAVRGIAHRKPAAA